MFLPAAVLGRPLRVDAARLTAKAGLLAAIAFCAALVLTAGSARAGDLLVRYDQSTLLRLPRPVADVIIGNPSIADVAVQGPNLLVVTGKTFGVTNIIALDSDRNVIQDQRVVVQQDERHTVNLDRAGLRQSYSCSPFCAPTMTIGDDTTYFDNVSKHSQTKARFSDMSSAVSNQQESQ